MSTGGDPQVAGKVFSDSQLARQTKRLLDILEPMVDSPHIEGNMLAEMAENNLELGMSVKDTVGNHTQGVKADTLGEAQRRTNEPAALGPELLVDGACGVAGVEVEGDIQVCNC